MAIPLIMMTPDSSRSLSGNFSPTLNGAVNVVPYGNVNAWDIQEATTNYVPNPLFNGMGTWLLLNNTTATPNGDGTCTLVLPEIFATLRMAYMTAGIAAPVTLGQTWTASIQIKNSGPTARTMWFGIMFHSGLGENDWTSDADGTYIGLPNDGQWYTYTYTRTVTDAASAYCHIHMFNSDNSTMTVMVKEPQLELKAYPTQFCPQLTSDGALKNGFAWAGTPNASRTTRTMGIIQKNVPEFSYLDGSVYIRGVASKANGFSSTAGYAYSIGNWSTNTFLGIARSTSDLQFLSRTNNVSQGGTTSLSSSNDVVVSMYHEWTPTTSRGILNGIQSYASARTTPSAISSTVMSVGAIGNQAWNGLITLFVLFPRALTPSELATLDATATKDIKWATFVPAVGGMAKSTFVEPRAMSRSGVSSSPSLIEN